MLTEKEKLQKSLDEILDELHEVLEIIRNEDE